MSLDAISGVQ